MKNIIIKYYLPVFLVALITIVPVILMNLNSGKLVEIIISISVLVILLTIVLGTLNYKFGDKLAYNKKKKFVKNELFQWFVYKGFIDNEVSVSGYYNRYYVIISVEEDSLQPSRWVEIVILFNPKQQNQFIPNYVFEKLYRLKKRNYSWNSNCLKIKKVFGFRLPKYNVIKDILDEAIKIFKQYNIEPITHENWDLSIKESVNHYNQISKLKS